MWVAKGPKAAPQRPLRSPQRAIRLHWRGRCASKRTGARRSAWRASRTPGPHGASGNAGPGRKTPAAKRRACGHRRGTGWGFDACSGRPEPRRTRESNAGPDDRRRVDRSPRNRGSVMAGARAEKARIDALLRAEDRELSQAMSRASTRARMQAVQVARATRANGGGARLKAACIKPPRRTSCRPSGASSEAGSDGPSGAVREWLRARPAEAARWGTAEGYPSTSRWAGLGRSDRRWRTRVTSSGTGPASRHSAHPRVVRGALPGVAGAR